MQPIADWLEKLGMSEYAERFEAHHIDVSILPDLTDQDLEKLGVLLGDRRKMLRAIRELAQPLRTSPQDSALTGPTHDEAERRQLTVMFCDLVGSTALSTKLDPEDLREIVRAYHRCCTVIVERNGGYVAKYMGDGVLAYFGYPQAHEHDPERAVHAGLALVQAVPNLRTAISSPLQVRIGIATGLVVVGDLIGKGAAQEQAVVGETPNLAARLQAIADAGCVVVAENTRTLLGNLFEFQDLGSRELKGISTPVRAWAALRPSTTESRFDALHTTGLTRLVGRKEEIELLQRRWSSARMGEGQVVLLSGEAGIGKSRIAVAIMEHIATEPHTRLRYFCSPQHTDSALHPVAGQMERAAGLLQSDKPQARLDKLDALLGQTSTSAQDAALFAGMLLLPNDGRYPSVELAPELRKHKTLEALLSQVVRLASRNPVLMIFEDVHWIDPTSLEVLDLVARRIASQRVLLLITFRPEFRAPWEGQAHVTSLTLNRLPSRDAAAIIAGLVGSGELAADVSAEIVERTDGIPLFVEEMTKAVLEAENEGAARRAASMIPSHAQAIPASLHASLLARLDRLGQAKEVAQIGAAIGREFSHDLLAAVAQRAEAELAPALNRLVEAGLLFRQGVPPDAHYLFKHALVQDVAYDTLLREKRQQLHARIATVLDRQFDVGDSQPELLARHYTLAAMPREAINHWQRAGDRATKGSANKEAITHFRNALQLLEMLPERAGCADQELQLLIALGPALMTTRSSVAPEIGQVYARARELASEGERVADLFPTVWGAWLIAFSRGDFATAARLVEELFGMANTSANSELALQAHHAAWPSFMVAGALATARHHIEKGVGLYRREAHGQQALQYGGHDPGVCGYGSNAIIVATMGYPDQALEEMQKGLALARDLDHPPTLALALWFATELHQIRREPAKVEDYVTEALPLLAMHGSAVGVANATMLCGWARVMQGEHDHGIALMQEGLANWRKTGSKFHVIYRLVRAAEAHLIAGKTDDGLRLIDEADGDSGDVWFAPELDRLRGELLFKASDGEEAESCLRRALDAAHAQEARLLELRAATSLAKLLEARGRRTEAEGLLAPIYSQFDQGLETTDLRNARDWLDKAV
ncbi:adenylate/guanylate cyclase domain-containing protein [Bradyrhizobium sp. Tv2a-2]|uniref:adenylate/guanylate cyclase domain-containing protein n=1 Tax=Bradyrhizobium sp. Tv2a-2 TaxID=113395 RepID=UPI000421813F|nr:adenylate/guanylate cyclase domain-containing protein [Bradyrhizobium sp. Tv2a-2]